MKTPDIVNALKISRQAAANHLRALVEEGLISKEGSTHNAIYLQSTGVKNPKTTQKLSMVKTLKNLEEDKVFDEIERREGLNIDNKHDNVILGEQRSIQGTEVSFSIKTQTRKKLHLFDKYSEAKFEFDKNILKLSQISKTPLTSRSQARRLTIGLEMFDSIVIDFEGVKEIGQGFADEIFRVFVDRHPEKTVKYLNTIPIIEKMIARAIAERT